MRYFGYIEQLENISALADIVFQIWDNFVQIFKIWDNFVRQATNFSRFETTLLSDRETVTAKKLKFLDMK